MMGRGTLVNWIGLACATPVVFWAGLPFFERAWLSLAYRSPNMFTLIALGTGSAYCVQPDATVVPGLFPETLRMHDGAVETYFETAAVITVLVLLGQVMELRARDRTSSAIRQLLGLAPKMARVVRDDKEIDVPLSEVRAGDVCRVRPAREGAGRRRGDQRVHVDRREHGDRRADPRREAARFPGVTGGDDQRDGLGALSG
jgi:Cu+-exporting ATPase